jgi:putative spermidine/putrescine transport system permease protein
VTTNFAGAPLAFSFIVILGSTGIVTRILLDGFGIGIYPEFSIYSISGLTLAYLYFQLPLMVLLIVPALEGLRREWSEAAHNLGASSWQYWRMIGLPILTPAILGGFVLLFANAFGAFATAYTLVGSDLNLATLQIAFLMTGDVRHDPALASAMAVVMLLVMAVSVALFRGSQRRFARWT